MVQLHFIKSCFSSLYLFYQFLGIKLFNFFNLHLLSVFIVITSNNKLCLHRKLLSRKAKSLFSNIKAYTFYFKEDTTWSNRCNPSSRITFTLTHTHVSRLACDRFIREYSNPDIDLDGSYSGLLLYEQPQSVGCQSTLVQES